MTLHSKYQDENPLPAHVVKHQERLILELVSIMVQYDVPTYADQMTTTTTPRDENKPRQVMEPAQRLRWVLEQLSDVKNKNLRLSSHAKGLEAAAKEHERKMGELLEILTRRDDEIIKLTEERDKALKKIADEMVSRSGRGRSTKAPR